MDPTSKKRNNNNKIAHPNCWKITSVVLVLNIFLGRSCSAYRTLLSCISNAISGLLVHLLTVVDVRIVWAVKITNVARVVALDISKVFDRIRYNGQKRKFLGNCFQVFRINNMAWFWMGLSGWMGSDFTN